MHSFSWGEFPPSPQSKASFGGRKQITAPTITLHFSSSLCLQVRCTGPSYMPCHWESPRNIGWLWLLCSKIQSQNMTPKGKLLIPKSCGKLISSWEMKQINPKARKKPKGTIQLSQHFQLLKDWERSKYTPEQLMQEQLVIKASDSCRKSRQVWNTLQEVILYLHTDPVKNSQQAKWCSYLNISAWLQQLTAYYSYRLYMEVVY